MYVWKENKKQNQRSTAFHMCMYVHMYVFVQEVRRAAASKTNECSTVFHIHMFECTHVCFRAEGKASAPSTTNADGSARHINLSTHTHLRAIFWRQFAGESALSTLQVLRLLPRDIQPVSWLDVADHWVLAVRHSSWNKLKSAWRREIPAPEMELFFHFVIAHADKVTIACVMHRACVSLCLYAPFESMLVCMYV
jgi:hypothetical protein